MCATLIHLADMHSASLEVGHIFMDLAMVVLWRVVFGTDRMDFMMGLSVYNIDTISCHRAF